MFPVTVALLFLAPATLSTGAKARVLACCANTFACTNLVHAYPPDSPVHNEHPLCHVQGTITYAEGPSGHVVPDTKGNATLTWEVFLPDNAAYNGRYLGVGNGGYAGVIANHTMLTHLNTGYAVAGCDSGHPLSENGNGAGLDASYMDDLAKVKAWIHDSIALTTRVARDAIAAGYYGRWPAHSYYYGCSTGGGQAYALAHFYPELFDGVVAEGPGNYISHLVLSFLWAVQHTQGAGFLDASAIEFLSGRVMDACDVVDGVRDSVIENPLHCDFDIRSLQCAPGQSSTATNETICLTDAQITAAQYIYSGATDSRDGTQVYPGFNLGAEPGWLQQQTALFPSYGVPIFRQLVFNNASYDAVRDFNWASDLDAVDTLASPLLDGIATNLTAFHNRGAKFITAQGWADPINAATWPMRHMQDLAATMGKETVAEFMRLFMVPGGGHCGANAAYPQVPARYHLLDALVEWVEQGRVPDDGILSDLPPDGSDTTRRLCAWPRQAVFVGGDLSDWMSYECLEI
ncbi:Tannase/feruloyl esterase [Aspergillus insuetus]